MIKKTIQSLAFFAFFQVLIFSCCDDTFNVYYDTVEFIAEDSLDFDSTTVASENLVLNLSPVNEYIMASNFNVLKPFSNTAMATSCDPDYNYQETISSVLVTTNTDLFGIPSGNSLNEKLSFVNPQTDENEPFENILNALNRQNGYARYDSYNTVLNESVPVDTILAFTVTITITENGRTLEATTETITIE